MSGGGPPHHPHNRHVPPANSAWNHLPVPSYFPRQPQVAHMQAEHSLLHQASWHTPTTTDAMKLMPHSQMLNEMFKNEALFPRDCVDLSLTRNGNQNGEVPSTPTAISLSVRDTSKINSLPPSMLDIQAMELTKCASPNLKSAISPGSIRTTSMSPGLKAASPGLLASGPGLKSLNPGRKSLSPGPKSSSPGLNLGGGVVLPPASTATMSTLEVGKNQKRSNIRVDSILERLNPTPDKTFPFQEMKHDQPSAAVLTADKSQIEKPPPSQSQSVIVSAASNYDENSNSSGTTNVPTPKEEDSASMNSNEDSLDSTKSRRKRKPSKTIRVNKEDEIKAEREQISPEAVPTPDLQTASNHRHQEVLTELAPLSADPAVIATILEGTGAPKLSGRRLEAGTDELDGIVPAKTRRKASSESETIDNIAAMVQEGLKEKGRRTTALVGEGSGDEERKVEEAVVKADSEDIEMPAQCAAGLEVAGLDMDLAPAPPEKTEPIPEADVALASPEKTEPKPEVDIVTVLTEEDNKEDETLQSESVSMDTVDGLEMKEPDQPEQVSESVPSDTVDGFEMKEPDQPGQVSESVPMDTVDGLEMKEPDQPEPVSESVPMDTVDGLEMKEPDQPEPVSESVPTDTVDGLEMKEPDQPEQVPSQPAASASKPVTVSVIKTKEILEETLSSGHDVPPEPPCSIEGTLASAPSLVTPAQKKASITHFVEVENKLEEMFAGIVEEDHVEAAPAVVGLEPLKNDSTFGLTDDSFIKLDDSVTSTKQEAVAGQGVVAEPPEDPPASPKREVKKEDSDDKKPAAKKTRRNRPPSKRESDLESEVPSKKKRLTKTKAIGTPPKKLVRPPAAVVGLKSPKKIPFPVTSNKTPVKTASADVAKDVCSYDSSSNASFSKSRGPFVQIRGPRDSPVSVSVVNTPLTGDEDGERKPLKTKKFHDDSEYRHKVRSKGLHCSTLSTKYDAERKDATWICAFCKRGPHASELTGPSVISEVPPPGDLFGPYFITTQCPEFEKRLDDPYDRQFKSRKISKVLDATAAASSKNSKKTKRKSESSVDPTDVYLGITDTGNNTFEVWVHEDCMVWSSGVYLVGPKIAGLEEAVWTCSNLSCSGCGLRGANVTCVKRGCLGASHLCCARKAHWHLDEANFKAYCPEHAR